MNSDSIKLHGYSVAAGFETARKAVADNLNKRFGTSYTRVGTTHSGVGTKRAMVVKNLRYVAALFRKSDEGRCLAFAPSM